MITAVIFEGRAFRILPSMIAELLMLPVVEWMLSSVRVLPEESAAEVFIGFGACTRLTLNGIVPLKK
jgi:hypothetical protein